MFELDLAALTDRGRVRETNQDVARVVPRLSLAVVADGLGGHPDGALAAVVAADAFVDAFSRLGGLGDDVEQTRRRVERAVVSANAEVGVRDRQPAEGLHMSTTLVAAVFSHGSIVVSHVGDSRCYRLRAREVTRLTLDHTLLAELSSEGRFGGSIPPTAMQGLTRVLDGAPDLVPEMTVERCEPDDVYVLCTDGVWGELPDAALVAAIARSDDARTACRELVHAACASGGHDNVGVAVARLAASRARLDAPWLQEPARDSARPPPGAGEPFTPPEGASRQPPRAGAQTRITSATSLDSLTQVGLTSGP